MFVLHSVDNVHHHEINIRGRHGHHGGIEAVENAAVSGQYLSAVLDVETTLNGALKQIAQGAEKADHYGKAQPDGQTVCGEEMPQDAGCNEAEHAAADGAHPGFVWGNPWRHLLREIVVEQTARAIGTGVVRP